ncbi:MAG TPA: flagellin [Dokdonella sp.]|nr:flagellin [Dokdonella sp.]
MSLTINTNVNSLNAQRNLSSSQNALSTSLERLSSGLRINSAKDDAAGLAIANRFSTQIRGLNQAVRNANDGISLSQTTESALGEVNSNLQRIRELAVQSANGTNNAADRAALNSEVQQRLLEINRIATQTSFNGTKTLDGSAGQLNFQVGANAGETIGINLSQGVGTNQIGQYSRTTATDTGVLGIGPLTTLTFGADQSIVIGTGANQRTATVTAGTYSESTLQSAINDAFNNAGITNATATVDFTAGTLQVDTRLGQGQAAGSADIGASGFGLAGAAATTALGSTLDTLDVSTVNGANDALASVDAALTTVSNLRSSFGAIQNRFESTISNLQAVSQNLDASRGRIEDADFAAETAKLTRAQILQQAGISVLSQANSLPQSVLKLLG